MVRATRRRRGRAYQFGSLDGRPLRRRRAGRHLCLARRPQVGAPPQYERTARRGLRKRPLCRLELARPPFEFGRCGDVERRLPGRAAYRSLGLRGPRIGKLRSRYFQVIRNGFLSRYSSSRGCIFATISFELSSIAFVCHLTAASKSPASACAIASPDRKSGFLQSVSSQARVASATACLPSRNLSSLHPERNTTRWCSDSGFSGSMRTLSL